MPHYHQKDIIMKSLTAVLSGNALRKYGVEGVELAEALPTELPLVDSRQIDMAWRTKAGDVFHLEPQTDRETTLHRFLEYDARLARIYRVKVRTVVLASLVEQFYEDGREEGQAQGLERGREQGREQGSTGRAIADSTADVSCGNGC